MEMAKKKVGEVDVLSIMGRIDAYNSPQVAGFVNEIIEDDCDFLLIEMGDLEYMSSSGLRVLLSSLKKLNNTGGTIKLCSIQPHVLEVLEMAGFTEIFEIYESQQEALGSD